MLFGIFLYQASFYGFIFQYLGRKLFYLQQVFYLVLFFSSKHIKVDFTIVLLSPLNKCHAFHTSCHPLISHRVAMKLVLCWFMKMCYLLSPNYLLFALLLRTISLSLSVKLGAEIFMW